MINLGDKYFQIATNIKGTNSIKFYIKAASEYSLSNQKYKSGLSYQSAAYVFFTSDLKYQAALNYIKASNEYNNVDNDKSLSVLTLACNLLNITKHFKLAATNLESLGILNIKEKRFLEAIDSYEKAIRNYKYLRLNKEVYKCFRKIATIMIHNEDYERAIVYLEKKEGKNNETFLDIGILRLYVNDITFFREYLIKHSFFMLTKEYFLLNDLLTAFDEKDLTKFQKLIINHKKSLLKWQYNLLLKISERI